MVDLTGDKDYDEGNLYNIETIAGLQSPPSPKIGHRSKRIKNIQYSSPPQEKSIQWRQAEVLQYNPNFPAAHHSLIPATQPLTPMSFNTAINPPFFPPGARTTTPNGTLTESVLQPTWEPKSYNLTTCHRTIPTQKHPT